MEQLKQENKKAFITYVTAGLPDLEKTKEIIRGQERAGTDVIELGIPFSDPIADGPVIQKASFESIQTGTTLEKVFGLMEDIRGEGAEVPIVFMMYYNTIIHYGLEKFVRRCRKTGVDGLIVPDLPMEEQEELQSELRKTDPDDERETILLQLVSPVSGKRIPEILKGARGFVYCVSSMGVTGQKDGFHKEIRSYLEKVKKHSSIPVMMGFGIRTPEDVEPVKDLIDGAIVGSQFIRLLYEHGFDPAEAEKFSRDFRDRINRE